MYLSFLLIGILAFGVTVATLPRAMAKPEPGSTGDQMMLILQEIRETVLGIKERTDNLPDDPASQSDVQASTLGDLQVFPVFSAFEDIDELECSSDSPFLAVASLTNTNAGGTLSVVLEPAGGGLTALSYKLVEAKSLTFGAEAGDTLKLKGVEGAGIGDGVVAFITVQSPQGAEISCVQS